MGLEMSIPQSMFPITPHCRRLDAREKGPHLGKRVEKRGGVVCVWWPKETKLGL